MHMFNAVKGEILPITGSEYIVHMSVARLITEVSKLSSLPVSAFRLSSSTGVNLYDCNHLQDYAIQVGRCHALTEKLQEVNIQLNGNILLLFVVKHRLYSPVRLLGWVERVPRGLPPGLQINSPEPPIRGEDSDGVRNSSLQLK